MTTAKIECRLPRVVANGARVPCVEETEPGNGRPIVAVISDRHLDREGPLPGPWQGMYLVPLDGDPTYGNDDSFLDGPWHYISVTIYDGRVCVTEVKWPDTDEARKVATDADIVSVDLDWDFGDDDGVETIRIPRNGVTIVVPLRFVPDDREIPRDTSMSVPRRPSSPAERRRNGLTV